MAPIPRPTPSTPSSPRRNPSRAAASPIKATKSNMSTGSTGSGTRSMSAKERKLHEAKLAKARMEKEGNSDLMGGIEGESGGSASGSRDIAEPEASSSRGFPPHSSQHPKPSSSATPNLIPFHHSHPQPDLADLSRKNPSAKDDLSAVSERDSLFAYTDSEHASTSTPPTSGMSSGMGGSSFFRGGAGGRDKGKGKGKARDEDDDEMILPVLDEADPSSSKLSSAEEEESSSDEDHDGGSPSNQRKGKGKAKAKAKGKKEKAKGHKCRGKGTAKKNRRDRREKMKAEEGDVDQGEAVGREEEDEEEEEDQPVRQEQPHLLAGTIVRIGHALPFFYPGCTDGYKEDEEDKEKEGGGGSGDAAGGSGESGSGSGQGDEGGSEEGQVGDHAVSRGTDEENIPVKATTETDAIPSESESPKTDPYDSSSAAAQPKDEDSSTSALTLADPTDPKPSSDDPVPGPDSEAETEKSPSLRHPHQWYRLVGEAGAGNSVVYEGVGVQAVVRKIKVKREGEGQGDHASANAAETGDSVSAPAALEGEDDDYDEKEVVEWEDVEGMRSVAIKASLLPPYRTHQKAGVESRHNKLLKEYDLSRFLIADFAQEGVDATKIFVPALAHGSMIYLPPGERAWVVSRLVATIYPLHEPFNKVLDGTTAREYSEQEIIHLWQRVVEKVNQFNGQDWIHRDVKAMNIVVTNEKDEKGNDVLDVLLIDIEGAKRIPLAIRRGESLGTRHYMAPHVIGNIIFHLMKDNQHRLELVEGEEVAETLEKWHYLTGDVQPTEEIVIVDDVDQWSLGIQLLEWLNHPWMEENYAVVYGLRELEHLCAQPLIDGKAVAKLVRGFGHLFAHMVVKHSWIEGIKETDRAIFVPLVKSLLKPSFTQGFHGCPPTDRKPEIEAAARGLGAYHLDHPVEYRLQDLKPIPYKPKPSKAARLQMTVAPRWGFYPAGIDFLGGKATLELDEKVLEDGSRTYTCHCSTELVDDQVTVYLPGRGHTAGFNISGYMIRCTLPGCRDGSKSDVAMPCEFTRLEYLKRHLSRYRERAMCQWLRNHPEYTDTNVPVTVLGMD